MPFAGFRQPSLALGLLAATLQPLAVPVRTLHASLRFAELIGAQSYDLIANWRAEDLLGDWLFCHHLRDPRDADAGTEAGAAEEYFQTVLAGGAREHRVPYFGKPPLTAALREELLTVRARTGELLSGLAAEIAAARPAVVGFTSMVHQQTASLALARRLRAALPQTRIILGGPACHGVMGEELLHSYAFVDAVATGEGEAVLPAFVSQALSGEVAEARPGLLVREGGARVATAGGQGPASGGDPGPTGAVAPPACAGGPAPLPIELDSLPFPDFRDYFDQLQSSPLRGTFTPRLPFESSRGCWWGERCRCTFCGQASDALTYRAKSPGRALAELGHAVDHHSGLPVVITDEIVPEAYFDAVVPHLLRVAPRLQVVYLQIRPDLSRERLAALATAGVRRVEAGVESLGTSVLRLMRKGTTMITNVQFLKWARELGLDVVWNVLWGLPGESAADYQRMADLVPLLTHLQPPNTVGAFRLDRFSPVFEDAPGYGVGNLRPYPAWDLVYGLPSDRLARLATSFAFDYGQPQPVERYTLPLAMRIADWKEQHRSSRLAFADEEERLVIFEGRPGFDAGEVTVLDGDHRFLYAACAAARPAHALAAELSSVTARTVTAEDVEALLDPLVEQGLMVSEARRYLALALPLPPRQPA